MEYFKDKEPREFRERLVLVSTIVIVVFIALGARLWHLQIMKSSYFSELSETNRIRLVHNQAPRGLVFDKNGTLLIENHPGFDLFIIPEDVREWDETVRMLSEIAGIDKKTIEKRLSDAKRRPRFQPVRIKEDLNFEEMARTAAHSYELPGVVITVGPKRAYNYGASTAHLTGYLGEITEAELKDLRTSEDKPYRGGDLTGKDGVEAVFEYALKGLDGGRQIEVDVRGREIKVLEEMASVPGQNLTLTIDLDTQMAAWDSMIGKAGAVVALDPANGKVLALVSAPSFDPNLFSVGVSKENWGEILRNPLDVMTNRAIQGQYPPASTFKVITAAAALEEEVIDVSTKIKSGGAFHYMKHTYRDWKASGHGEINVERAIIESSDTFFYQVGLLLGINNIESYSKAFGLNRPTGLGFRNEKTGLVPSIKWKKDNFNDRWYDGETIILSVGQGFMLATPLQMLNAYSAIANGGTIFRPQVVEKIESSEGELIESFTPEVMGTLPISEENRLLIRNALRGVVADEGGTARWINKKSLNIAGKTGTAQVVRMKERIKDISKQPYNLRDHALFVGFAPYDDPKIAVAVIVEHGGFGSATAAPIALRVIDTYLTKVLKEEEAQKAAEEAERLKTEAARKEYLEEKTVPVEAL